MQSRRIWSIISSGSALVKKRKNSTTFSAWGNGEAAIFRAVFPSPISFGARVGGASAFSFPFPLGMLTQRIFFFILISFKIYHTYRVGDGAASAAGTHTFFFLFKQRKKESTGRKKKENEYGDLPFSAKK
jgi:hypothetical protein